MLKNRIIIIISLTYQFVVTVVMKNCEPLESGPEFAIDKTPEKDPFTDFNLCKPLNVF